MPTTPRCLVALWVAFVAFVASFFRRSPEPAPVSPPASPARSLPTLSLSGLFATPPSDLELGPLSPAGPPESHPPTPNGPSSLASPTTMSDGSLEVVSLSSPRRTVPLPSPWSPVGKNASQDVWMSVNGTLMNATGPVHPCPVSPTGVRMSTPSLYSSTSALDAFGISVFVSLGDTLGTPGAKDDPFHETLSTPTTLGPRTPRKRRETIPSVKKSGASSNTTRATKCLSTPLTRIENIDVSHLRSTNSFSSMAYEFRMGLIADGRSMSAIEHIISLLDQDSPEQTLNSLIQPVQVV